MIPILTRYTANTNQAQIRSAAGKVKFRGSCTESQEAAARNLVEKYYSAAAAETVREIKDPATITSLGVDDYLAHSKTLHSVYAFDPKAKPRPVSKPLLDPWASARAHADNIRGGLRVTLVSVVALGLHLRKLREELGYSHGGNRRSRCNSSNLKPWPELVAEKTGWSYERCNHFIKLGTKVKEDALASRSKKTAQIRALLTDLPDRWEQGDYEALASHLTDRFDATDIKGLMLETGLVTEHRPPPPPKSTPITDEQMELDLVYDAHIAIATPLIEIAQIRSNPQHWQNYLDRLPRRLTTLPDGREVLGLEETITILTQVREDAMKRLKELSQNGRR